MKLIVKHFFLAEVLFLGGHLRYVYIFPWKMGFFGGIVLD